MDHKSRFDCKKCGDSCVAIGQHFSNPMHCPDCETKITLRGKIADAAIEYVSTFDQLKLKTGRGGMITTWDNLLNLVRKLDREVK